MIRRLVLGLAAAGSVAGSALGMEFRRLPYSDETAQPAWRDYRLGETDESVPPPKMLGVDDPAFVAVATASIGGDEWVVAQINDVAWCGFQDCPTRVFRNGEIEVSTDSCSFPDGENPSVAIRPAAAAFRACGETKAFDPQRAKPVRFPNGTTMLAPGWSTRVKAVNDAFAANTAARFDLRR